MSTAAQVVVVAVGWNLPVLTTAHDARLKSSTSVAGVSAAVCLDQIYHIDDAHGAYLDALQGISSLVVCKFFRSVHQVSSEIVENEKVSIVTQTLLVDKIESAVVRTIVRLSE